jgi:hypothetical protein
MKNIINARQQLLDTLNLGTLIEEFTPLTMQGTSLKKQLVESFNAGNLSYVVALTEVIASSSKLNHLDSSVSKLTRRISESLEDSMSAKLVYCSEIVQSMRPSTFNESLINQLDSLLVLEDSQIIQKIRSGVLNPYKSIHVVGFVIESAAIKTENSVSTALVETFNPVTYTEENSHGVHVRLHNSVYCISESSVRPTNSPSPKFTYLSSIVEGLSFNRENESFIAEHANLGRFEVSKDQIKHITENNEFVYESTKAFSKQSSLIFESRQSKNSMSKAVIESEKKWIDAIINIQENFENIALSDNILMVENIQRDEKFAFIVAENMFYVSTLKSNRLPNELESFSNVKEALKKLEKISGYNASLFVSEHLTVADNAAREIEAKASSLKTVIESLNEKHTEIVKLIKEEKSKEPKNEERLIKLNDALKVSEAFILEQRTELATITT